MSDAELIEAYHRWRGAGVELTARMAAAVAADLAAGMSETAAAVKYRVNRVTVRRWAGRQK